MYFTAYFIVLEIYENYITTFNIKYAVAFITQLA